MTLLKALDRTLLLMRDEVLSGTADAVLFASLTSTTVVLAATGADLTTHSAQTAFVTAALLMARSGHAVHLCAPDVPLIGCQHPLEPGRMITELLRCGEDLLPGYKFHKGEPTHPVDLVVAFGNTKSSVLGRRHIAVNAGDWSASIGPACDRKDWAGHDWPFGAMAAGVLAAGEAFKASMLKLVGVARNPTELAQQFAFTDQLSFELAPWGTPTCSDLGEVDFISGGAITNAALYVLARINRVSGHGRIIEPDTADLTNLNRYPLLLFSNLGHRKAGLLAEQLAPNLSFESVLERYTTTTLRKLGKLAPNVVVGVDHIPTRWVVQADRPAWLAVGATTHWSAMASFHVGGMGCAQCLHPTDDPTDAPIPTMACVSFWAGLLTATYLVRHLVGADENFRQQIFLTPFRPENEYSAPVPIRKDCPTCQSRMVA